MNQKVIVDAFLGFIISFGGQIVTLLMQEGVVTLSDISQGAYVSALLGSLVATAKVLQSKLSDSPENVKQTNDIVTAAANLEKA